jgi:hypothetical protein
MDADRRSCELTTSDRLQSKVEGRLLISAVNLSIKITENLSRHKKIN